MWGENEMATEIEKAEDYKKYLDFINCEEYAKLYEYYQKSTFMDVLGVARQENPHSSFWRWLIDDKKNQGLGKVPLRKLIETVCFAYRKLYEPLLVDSWFCQKSKKKHSYNLFCKENEAVLKAMMKNQYEVMSIIEVSREKELIKPRRVDIYAEVELKVDDRHYKLFILIENKVGSSEGENQTVNYVNDLYQIMDTWVEKDTANNKALALLCYLSPLPNEELKAKCHEQSKLEKHCKSWEFVCINYQYLVDGVIEPCLIQVKNSEAKFLLQDYLRCLGKAVLDPTNSDIGRGKGKGNGNTDYIVMAIGRYEKRLASALWSKPNHKEVMMKMFEDMATSDKPEELGALKEFYCSIASTLLMCAAKSGNEDNASQSEKHYKVSLLTVERAALESVCTAARDSVKRCSYTFTTTNAANQPEKKEYTSGKRGDKTLGFLAHEMLKKYLQDSNHSVNETIKKLREAGINNTWLKDIIITQARVDELKKPDYVSKGETKKEVTSIEEFEHYFYNYQMDPKTGRKITVSNNDQKDDPMKHYAFDITDDDNKNEITVYTARFFGSTDIDKMIVALGMSGEVKKK